jgi:hypothetical protein
MRTMIRRVERLERALGVSDDPPDPPMEILVKYVSPDGSVVGSHVIKIDPPLQRFRQPGVNRFPGRQHPRSSEIESAGNARGK